MALLDELMQYAISVDFDDYPLIGQTASRNQSITTVQASPRFWKFTVDLQTPILRWEDHRAMVQRIRSTAQYLPFTFTLANTPLLHTLVNYQGTLSPTELAALTVRISQGGGLNYLYLENGPANRQDCFLPGDYIQTGNAVRTVVTAADSDGIGQILLTLSDPLLAYPAIGSNIVTGTQVAWNNCYFTELPTPGISYEFMDGITWTGKFKLVQTLS